MSQFSFEGAVEDGGAQGILRGLEQSAVETPRLGMGTNDECLHGLMMADLQSTLNSQPAIEQPRLVAPTCRVKV
jgi:hypothetical protein